MADPVKIKVKGTSLADLELQLENFSTEETLQKLLDLLTDFTTKVLAKINNPLPPPVPTSAANQQPASSSGGGGSATGGLLATLGASGVIGELGEFGEAIAAADIEIWLIAKAAELLEVGISILSQSISSLFSVTGNLISTFTQGKTALSDYTDAIAKGTSSIPLIGTFFGIIAAGISQLEKWSQALYDLNSAGADFHGNITSMIKGAADSGLSLEAYSKVVKDNIDKFATFGSVMEGVSLYTRVANKAIFQYSNQILDMGMSVQQFSEELPGVLNLFAVSARNRGASDAEITQSAIALTEQFNAMAKITGKTREQQAADLEKLTADAAWKDKMLQVGRNDAANYQKVLSQISSTMGESYAELYKFSVLGMPPLNKELQTLLATTPGLSTQFEQMTSIVKRGGPQMASAMDHVSAQMVGSALAAGASFDQIIAANAAGLTGSADEIAKARNEILSNTQLFYKNGQFQQQAYEEFLENNRTQNETAKAQQAEQDGIQRTLATFNTQMTRLQAQFYDGVLIPLLTQVSPIITQIVTAFQSNQGYINQLMSEVGAAVPTIVKILESIVGAMFTTFKWIADHWTVIKFAFEVVLVTIASVLGVVFGPILAAAASIVYAGVLIVDAAEGLHNLWEHRPKWLGGSGEEKTPSAKKIIPEPATPASPGKADHSAGTPEQNLKLPSGLNIPTLPNQPGQLPEHVERQTALLQHISDGIDSLVRSNKQIAVATV